MGAIINIFKSIIGLVTGLFSKKSKAAPAAVTEAAAPTAKAPKAPKAAKPKKGKDGFYMQADPLPAGTAPVAVAAPVAAPVAAAAPVATASVKKGGVPKKSGGKAGQAVAAAAVAVAAVTAAPPVVDPLDLIRAAVAPKTPALGEEAIVPGGPTFAELNAVPISSGNRRRPGANMTGFLDMAKTIRKR